MARDAYIAYGLTEADIRKNFLDWVILGDNTPIDIAYKANITQVERLLFPVRYVKCSYTAEWSAYSIWEKKEEYEVQVEMVTFVRIHSDGSVYGRSTKTRKEYQNLPSHDGVKIVDRFYKTETRTRTVVVDEHETEGEIDGCYSGSVIKLAESNSGLEDWLLSLCSIETAGEAVSEGKKMPLLESDDYAKKAVIPAIRKKAATECEAKVPGTKHKNFSVDELRTRYDITAVYCPVYAVTYEYEGKTYLVYMSGAVKDCCYSDDKPVDADLEAKKKELETELNTLKSARLKFGLFGFALPPVLFFILAALGLSNGVQTFMLLVELALAVFFIGFKFVPTHKKVKVQDALMKTHLGNLDAKKKEILAIVNNDTLTAEQQKEQIKKLIENN